MALHRPVELAAFIVQVALVRASFVVIWKIPARIALEHICAVPSMNKNDNIADIGVVAARAP
jgi:hypothetical protein